MHSQSLIDMISPSHCCHTCRNAFAKSIRDLAIFEMLQRWKNIARDQKCEDKISAVLVQKGLESRRWKSKNPTPGYGSYLAKMICVLLVVKSVPRGLHMPRVSGPVQQPQCFMMHIHMETRRHYGRKSSIFHNHLAASLACQDNHVFGMRKVRRARIARCSIRGPHVACGLSVEVAESVRLGRCGSALGSPCSVDMSMQTSAGW